jgi:membrane-associated phospholipid phosphatase
VALNHLPLVLIAALQVQAIAVPDTTTRTNVPETHRGPSEVLLGAAILGSLVAVHIEGINDVDDLFGSQPAGADRLIRRVPRNLGRFEAASGLAGGLFLLGEAADHPELRRAGILALEALALSSVGTTALKVAVGRSRPGGGRDEDEFHPFRMSSTSWSFPSGHTSAAFAVAGAVSSELGHDHGWVPFVAYPLATWVGVSRVVDGRHWASDVFAGAAMGMLSARLSRSWFGGADQENAPRLSPTTVEGPDGHVMVGVRLTFR